MIVPNFGGWGNVPLNKAKDLEPLIVGLQRYFDSCGLRTIIAPYRRAPAVFPEAPEFNVQLAVITEMLGFHRTRAHRLASMIETLAIHNPEVKFLLIGLSNGAAFVDDAMELLSSRFEGQVAAVAIGAPFWQDIFIGDDILHLDNEGNDPLTQGRLEELFGVSLSGLVQMFNRLMNGRVSRFEEAWHIPNHDYHWEKIRPMVIDFINRQLLADRQTIHH